MANQIQSDASVWIQDEADAFGSSNDGSTELLATPSITRNPDIGATSDTEATTNTGTFSLIALFKRSLGLLSDIWDDVDGLEALVTTSNTNTSNTATSTAEVSTATGAPADAVATSDTGSFGLIALVKRALQHLTTSNTNTSNTATSTGNTATSTATTATQATNLNTALGAQGDAEATSGTAAASVLAHLKRLSTRLDILAAWDNGSGVAEVSVVPTARTQVVYTGVVSASGDNEVSTVTGSFRCWNLQLQNESSTSVTAIVKSGSNNLYRAHMSEESIGATFPMPADRPLEFGLNESIQINLSAATDVGYTFVGYIE